MAAPVAFDAFCRQHAASVTGLAFVLTGSWTAAEDLAQDAFFAAYRGWDRIATYDDPLAWVRRVVANRAVSWRRRATSEAKAVLRLSGRRDEPPAAAGVPDHHLELWEAVRRLPPRQAQVVALTYLDDLDLAAVARVLDIGEGTARTHLRRGRAALATQTGLTIDDGAPR